MAKHGRAWHFPDATYRHAPRQLTAADMYHRDTFNLGGLVQSVTLETRQEISQVVT
jgi:cytochrome c-type biogenesis protein CcmE